MTGEPARFDPRQQIQEIVLVGCGGTGAQLARSLARLIYDLKRRRRHAPRLRLIDPDRVELKNVGRQLWVDGNQGQYKAEVLARRFNYGLGLDVEWVPDSFDSRRHVHQGTLLCGAVDNHSARAELARAHCLWVDAGNHPDGAAQVVAGNVGSWDQVNYDEKSNVYYSLPNAVLLFPSLLEPEPDLPAPTLPLGASCPEALESGEQGLLVNDVVAAVAAQYVYRFVYHEPCTSFITYIDTAGLSMRSIPLTSENLAVYKA